MKQLTKNKTLVYVLSAVGTALLFGLLSGLVFDYLIGYVILWSVFGLVLGSCIGRVILHIHYKDNSAEMWQIAIYHFLIGVGIIGVIYSDSWGWTDLSAAVAVGAFLMAAGSRFIRYYGGTLILYKIDNELKYYPLDNDPKKEEDKSRPIIEFEGQALTLAEAKAKGFTDAVATAREELIMIYGITLKEEEETK